MIVSEFIAQCTCSLGGRPFRIDLEKKNEWMNHLKIKDPDSPPPVEKRMCPLSWRNTEPMLNVMTLWLL